MKLIFDFDANIIKSIKNRYLKLFTNFSDVSIKCTLNSHFSEFYTHFCMYKC